MKEEEKLQIGIYKIDTGTDLFPEGGNSLDIVIDSITRESGFTQQALKKESEHGFKMALFYKNTPLNPKWKRFLTGVAKGGQEILKEDKSWAESFVFLLEKTESQNLYAITGGLSGYFGIQEFIADDFGVDILSRLIKKDEKVLKSVKEKSVMGGVLGSTKFFRKTYNLFENDGFGKIYQELHAKLDKKVLTAHFGFLKDELKDESVCVAKSSFRINKSIGFDRLLKIINGCEYVLEKLDPIAINSVKKIVKKRNQVLVQNLETELFRQLWGRYQKGEDFDIDFDLCHKEYDKYLTASKYLVKKNSSKENFFDAYFEQLDSIDGFFVKLKMLEDKPSNEDEFESLLRSLKIYSFDDEDNELTKGWLVFHLFGDVPLGDKRYFLIDKNWYEVENTFLEDLNSSCFSFIKENHKNDLLTKAWNSSDDENAYNKSYFEEKDTIVTDKITPENIEPCDVLKWDNENLYLCHVKKGFANTMRDLCSQIFIAASRLHDMSSSGEYVDKIYDQMKNKVGSTDEYFKLVGEQTKKISKTEFRKHFDKRKIFVLSIMDTGAKERSLLSPMKNFHSNIAKFSLQELVKAMRGIGVEFKISQIKRS